MVGRGDLLQGLALMSLLAARRLVRWSAQALGPGGARWFFEPVARRRLAAVRTVQPEPPLKLGDPRLQSRDLRRLRRDQRNQLFTRPLPLRIRIRTHRILESKADSAVEKNLPAQPPRHATINLGSYAKIDIGGRQAGLILHHGAFGLLVSGKRLIPRHDGTRASVQQFLCPLQLDRTERFGCLAALQGALGLLD